MQIDFGVFALLRRKGQYGCMKPRFLQVGKGEGRRESTNQKLRRERGKSLVPVLTYGIAP